MTDIAAFRRRLAKTDPILAGVIRAAGKYTVEPSATHTPFHALASAITHQQLNGTAAMSIFNRLCGLYSNQGEGIDPKLADGETALLEAKLVLATADEKLRSVGLSYAKIASIKDLAAKTLAGVVPPYEILHTLADDQIVERITQVRGIGRWTVEMMLMFRLGRPDILPIDDFGVRNGFRLAYGLRGMPTPRALAEYGARWAPYRSVAAWYLWRAVDLHKAGKLPAPATPTRIEIVKKKKAKVVKKVAVARKKKRVAAKTKRAKRARGK
ncbi:MAG: DNA-3-methyladenine glycosylase 2 family protein [Steroidobacteraceae bacterium]|nr:DNA-3-methyladenine glycosylase 2 family protein [Steroidobacteraceae bacterium]